MRFLKNKVYKATQYYQSFSDLQIKKEAADELKQIDFVPEKVSVKQEHPMIIKQEAFPVIKLEPKAPIKSGPGRKGKKSSSKGSPGGKKEIQPNKNIVKNYARAMVNFALSDMALHFLRKFSIREGCDLKEFRLFVAEQKEDINSIKTLREMLLISNGDNDQVIKLKNMFRAISEIFVKFFSVNWIYNSKVSDKRLHLKYRYKILRRVRSPEHFTYLENFNKTK